MKETVVPVVCEFGLISYFDNEEIVSGYYCFDCSKSNNCSIYKHAIETMQKKDKRYE